MEKCRVLVFIGCRSDEGLVTPVLKRLENDGFFKCYVQTLYPAFINTYKLSDSILYDLDLVVCTGDRLEMFSAALASFLHNIPIAHIYAGVVVGNEPTKDEVFRHSISMMSELQFCESQITATNIGNLFDIIKKEKNIYIVGITHFDNLDIDETLVPDESYNLILYNPLTNPDHKKRMEWEIAKIQVVSKMGLFNNIIIGSNPDLWFDNTRTLYDDLLWEHYTQFYRELPRSQFLGLLKNCEKFISNSSAAIYEAPYFLKKNQIINIGIRNSNRTPPDLSLMGASDRIIKIIKEWWIKKNDIKIN